MNISDLETLPFDVPLEGFDRVIMAARSVSSPTTKDSELLKEAALRCILSLAGQNHIDRNPHGVEQLTLQLLDNWVEHQEQRTIAVCFLRLLAEPTSTWIWDTPWRPKVVALFDGIFAEDLYQEIKLDSRLMGHEKLEALSSVVPTHERELEQAMRLLTSLDRLGACYEKLSKALRSKMGDRLIRPFLPKGARSQLGEVFTRIRGYIQQRDELGVVDAYTWAIEGLDLLDRMVTEYGTLYCHWLAERVVNKLRDLISTEFGRNKAAQPAYVTVEPRDKKYPFHRPGHKLNLGIRVTNQGPGYAYNVTLLLAVNKGTPVQLSGEEIEVGRVAPNTVQLVEIDATVIDCQDRQEQVEVLIAVEWRDFDGSVRTEECLFSIKAQRSDLDWNQLTRIDPYSLEPVTDEKELVGRQEVLNRLIATTLGARTGSSIIQGQKRVGKTSIAKALQSHLTAQRHIVVYLEGGDYVEPSAGSTISRLGNTLCRKIRLSDSRTQHLPIPKFEEAFSPFSEFLDEVMVVIAEDRRILILLDEFDELPLELYERGNVGNPFFLSLRSISSRDQIGFVLIGSEKIAHVLDSQGEKLNRWNVISVDYFARDSDWTDYKELIQRPVADTLEYTEAALQALYEVTAGNPYFTKLVCQNIFREAVSKRDCHITRAEVEQAVNVTVRDTDRNSFQHFWEDGIFEAGERATQKSIRRRKILIALADVLAHNYLIHLDALQQHRLVRDIPSLEADLREFVTRKILLARAESYEFKVPLFHKWLMERGVDDLITTFADLDAALRERQQEEALRVRADEVVQLVKQWPSYKGLVITEDRVRLWLEQFEGAREQRVMFSLLQNLHFYSHAFIREKMKEVDGVVKRGLLRVLEQGKLKRSDILVSYLDSPAKSGGSFARLYVDEAGIYVDNVVEKGQLAEVLIERDDIQALVFFDDFAGTGQSVMDYLRELDTVLSEVINSRNIKVVFVAVVAFEEGWQRIEQLAEQLNIKVQTHVCELLTVEDKCFNEASRIFTDPAQRELARHVAMEKGKLLEKRWPVGYGNLEMVVVFERGCPNNSLPILWKESTNPRWIPLFKRH